MHQTSTQPVFAADSLPPSEDKTVDLDTEHLIAEKRREVEEEITQFKFQKEKELRAFEQDLQSRRRGRRLKPSTIADHERILSSPLALLNKRKDNFLVSSAPTNGEDAQATNTSPNRKPKPPLSKPTISVDAQNITNNYDLRLNAALPKEQSRSKSRSPSKPESATSDLPNGGDKSESEAPATPTREHPAPLLGLFTPSFLPLLDAKSQSPTRSQPIPTTTRDSSKIPARASNTNSAASSLPSSHSLSPILLHHQPERAHTAPVGPTPSTSLPLASALRTASGTSIRKRKHVTFKLADSAIVEPSSSYEEMSSPEPKEEEQATIFEEAFTHTVDDDSTNDGAKEDGNLRDAIEDPATPDRNQGLLTPPPSRKSTDSRQPGYFSPSFNPRSQRPLLRSRSSGSSSGSSPSPLRSPALVEPSDLTGDMTVSIDHAKAQATDGGSGIGFFELDEELESPGFRVPSAYLEEDDNEDGEKPTTNGEIQATEPDLAGRAVAISSRKSFPQSVSRAGGGKVGHRATSSSFDFDLANEKSMEAMDSAVGSVPIDIVRPTGSWVGSFGH